MGQHEVFVLQPHVKPGAKEAYDALTGLLFDYDRTSFTGELTVTLSIKQGAILAVTSEAHAVVDKIGEETRLTVKKKREWCRPTKSASAA